MDAPEGDQLLERLPDGFLIMDMAGAILYLNAAARDLFGYGEEDLRGLHFRDLCGDGWDDVRGRLEALRSGISALWPLNLRDKDGRVFWSEINMVLTEGDRVLVTVRAVQVRPWVDSGTDESVSRGEQDFRLLLDLFPEPAWLCDQAGNVIYCNKAWLAYTGQTMAQARGKGWVRALHPADLLRIAMTARRFSKTGESHEYTYRLRRADGVYRWQHVRTRSFRDEAGAISRWFGTSANVDEQVRTREALEAAVKERTAELREREDRLSVLFEQAPDAYFLADPDGKLVAVNVAAERLTGMTRKDLVDSNARELGIGPLAAPDGRGRAGADAGDAGDVTLVRKDGRRIEVAVRSVRLKVSGRPHMLMDVRDVTEQRRLEREVLRVSDLERERIGRELHDGLCQQLAGTRYFVSLIEQSLAKQSEQDAALARRVGELIADSVRQVRAIAAGLTPAEVSSEGLAAALAELASRMDGMGGVACVFSGRDVALADRQVTAHLYRIAQQAVSNAYQHATPKKVSIELGRSDGAVSLVVTDDGIGLPADAEARGGLGLCGMRYRARLINAELDIRSGRGGGTTVTCRLPAG
jgi:PAS domain S-box-containing protein